VVDVLRQCYSAEMAFFHDRPGELRTVHWYRVPETAKEMPWATAFGSRIYERGDEVQPAIGERFSPVPWRACNPPCPTPAGGLCGTEDQWANGASIDDLLPAVWPGTAIPQCCNLPLVGSCGGVAIGRAGFGACHMESTCDIYSPFGSSSPIATNVPCQFVEDLAGGRGTAPVNTVSWTHWIDVSEPVPILDGCTRTPSLDNINYFDGDEVRIPSGGATRYVVVWVTLCDTEGTVVKRAFLLRHSA